jgi:hypothetical protein
LVVFGVIIDFLPERLAGLVLECPNILAKRLLDLCGDDFVRALRQASVA